MELPFCLNMYQDIVLENENWISDFTQYWFVSKITIWPSQKMLWFVIYLKFRGVWFVLSKGRSVSLTSQLFQRKCVLLSLDNIYKLYYEFCQQDAGTNLSDQVRRWFGVLFTSNLEVCDLYFPLKLKEYKFNKSAFVLNVYPLIFENTINQQILACYYIWRIWWIARFR